MERGDYEVLHAEDCQVIDRSEFSSRVEPDMVLEMAIVMLETTALQDNKGKCPRCPHVNLNATVTNSWIEWQVHLNYVHTHT